MSQNYKIKIKIWPRLWLAILAFFDRVFRFFNLRHSTRFWGVVYDSVSKQPLDPVIVKLLYADSREVATGVTDIYGRYGFLARPGKFKIFARKSHYTFPSTYAAGSNDGIYENLYHGEFFVLTEDNEVVAPNIPMDPAQADWNQAAKLKVAGTHPFWKLFFKRLWAVAFWFGFVFSAVLFWRYFGQGPVWPDELFGAFFAVLALSLALPEPRLWGKLALAPGMPAAEGYSLLLHNLKFSEIIQGRTMVSESGRFLLRANPGKYLLSVTAVNKDGETPLGKMKVKVNATGVLNASILAKLSRK